MAQDFRLKDYSDSQDPQREVIGDLFSTERHAQVSALQFILHNPHPGFTKALHRKNEDLSDPYVIASFVKAAAVVLQEEALPLIAHQLRHPEARVRANCVEALELSGVDPSKKKILSILMNFISDPDPRVAGNCIKALSRSLGEEELTTLVQDYFEPSDPRRCLNTLYLIEKLQPKGAISILQACLNHHSEQIRNKARNLLSTFEKENPQARDISLRTTLEKKVSLEEGGIGSLSSREVMEKLVSALRNSETRECSHFLQELGRRGKNQSVAEFLRRLLSNTSLGMEPFILATAVKTLAFTSTESQGDLLQSFLNHEDGRVVSNTVEALSIQEDPILLEFLEKHIQSMDFQDPIGVRVLSSGMDYLKSFQRELAFRAMEQLAQGNLNSITTFLLHMEKWGDGAKRFESLVFQILKNEIRLEVTRSCLTFLEIHGDLESVENIQSIYEQLEEGEKKSLVFQTYQFLAEKTGSPLLSQEPAEKKDTEEIPSVAHEAKAEGKPARVLSNLGQKAASFLQASSTQQSWKISIPLGAKGTRDFQLPKQWLQWAGIFCAFLAVAYTGFLLLPGESNRFTPHQIRASKAAPSSTPDQPSAHNIKGRGTIQLIDFADGTIRTEGEHGEFNLQFEDLHHLRRFSTGQKVKFVGQYLEKDPTDVVQVKGKFIFEDRRLGKKKKKG